MTRLGQTHRNKYERSRLVSTPVRFFALNSAIVFNGSLDLLKEEKINIDLVGPTLQSLKAQLDPPPSDAAPEDKSKYSRLVHGLFSSCLVNIDEMR